MPQIAVIGTGYVGLVSGTCFAEWGFSVTCVDKNREKIDTLIQGGIPIYEPGLEPLVRRNIAQERLTFTTDLPAAVKAADVVFLAVGTPQGPDGHADLSYVYLAAEAVAHAAEGQLVMLTKSTVPVGTTAALQKKVKEWNPRAEIDVASNPEFLREGSAIRDFMEADRIIVGSESPRAREVMAEIYQPLAKNGVPVFFTDPHSAELIKYAANGFLATKVTFINEMADLCDKLGGSIEDVARGMGLDHRIGQAFLRAGPGYGGSCFPKDTHALAATARKAGAPTRIVEAVVEANDRRKEAMAERVLELLGNPKGKKLAVLGLTFKPDTDDMRESPSLVILPLLLEAGVKISAYDPAGMEQAKLLLPDAIDYVKDTYEALDGADAAVILTEWEPFKSLDFSRMKALMRQPLLIDLRNMFRPREIEGSGIQYHSIGRLPVMAQAKRKTKAKAKA